MRKLISILAALLLTAPALAGSGYHAGFTGVQDVCRNNLRTRPSTVAEYCFGAADGSGNVPDFSGGNLLTDRTEFDDWTEGGTCTVTADQYRNPLDGALDADYLDNTGGANTDDRRMDTVGLGVAAGQIFMGSVWIRSDYVHTCTVGVVEGGIATTWDYVTVTPRWRRYPVSGTLVGGGTGEVGLRVLPGERGVSTGTAYFYGAKLVENDEFRIGMGPFINPADQSITKPPLDLAPTNAPTPAKAHVQGVDGNRIEAREFNGTDQFYSKADHASMYIFDTDHTLTFVVEQDVGAAGPDIIFSHGNINTDGIYCFAEEISWKCRYNGGGGSITPAYVATSNDGRLHVLQMVRSGNTGTLYYDGNAGTPVDLTGFGLDAARTFYIGRNVGGNYFDGQISYVRIDAEALPDEELAYDREVLLGTVSNQPTNALSVTRATTAYTTFAGGTMAEIAVNQPRVGGPGGGLLVEGQGENLVLQSQDFSTTWSTGFATISTDVAEAPDGKTTVDGIIGTAVTNEHGVCQNEIPLTATDYTFHIWAQPGDQDWLYLESTVVANAYAYFNIATGFVGTTGAGVSDTGIESAWGNFYHAWIVFTGTVAQHTVCVYSAEADNDNQFLGDGSTVNTYVWQAQVEKGTFPTTIIPTTTVPVTRNADSITLDPHPSGKPEARALPETLAPNTNADKLTIYLEAKCQWSNGADLGGIARRLISITEATANDSFNIFVDGAGAVNLTLFDTGGTTHNRVTAPNPVDFSAWFSVRGVMDFTDLSRTEIYINGVAAGIGGVGLTGTAIFDTTGATIYVGDLGTIARHAHCHIRNPRITPTEVRAP